MEDDKSYPFLPEIAQSLEVMCESLSSPRDRRLKMAGALERLVTEVYSFSESPLGEELLKLSDDFSKY